MLLMILINEVKGDNYMKNNIDIKLYGGIFGFIVGDALGVPVEFVSRRERKSDPVNSMRSYGSYKMPAGTWSDDSSLTLCLMDSIIHGYSSESLAENFIKYYKYGFMTPYNKNFDIGITTEKAIERMMRGISPVECGSYSEERSGNGSLMRILPLAYYTKDMSPLERVHFVEEVSSLTHAQKICKITCIFYNQMAIELLNDCGKEEAYKNAVDFINITCVNEYSEEMKTLGRVFDGKIPELDEDDIKSSGYVVDTLEAVMWCFMTTDSYRDSVLKAVNLGEDTDTIAAITGGLSGIYYGYNTIPRDWLKTIAKKDDISRMIKEFQRAVNIHKSIV